MERELEAPRPHAGSQISKRLRIPDSVFSVSDFLVPAKFPNSVKVGDVPRTVSRFLVPLFVKKIV